MATAKQLRRLWTAEEFLTTDQCEFGDAWRYELVDGEIVAHAVPSPDHGAILSGLAAALGNRLLGNREGAVPKSEAAPYRDGGNATRHEFPMP
jgi:Uma2 family endonuclease